MRSIIALVLVSLFTSSAFSQKEDKKENKDNKETQNTKVTPGASGVKRSIGYRFSAATTDSDPGKGNFSYNNKNASDVSFIFVNDNDIKGEDQTKWYRTWEDSTGASGRGQILIVKLNSEVINIFDFTDVFTDGNGYWKFPVKYVSGTMPASDSVYYYIFNRIAHGRDKVEEIVEVVEKVEEAVEKIAEVVIAEPAVVPEPEPAAVDVKVEEPTVIVAPAEVPAAEPVVEKVEEVEVIKEEPAVAAEVTVPAAEPVSVEAKVEEAPVVVVPAAEPVEEKVEVVEVIKEEPAVEAEVTVPAAEPVSVEIKVEEAPVVIVPAAEPVEEKVEVVEKVEVIKEEPAVAAEVTVPAAEPVSVEVKVEEAPVVVVPAAEPVVEKVEVIKEEPAVLVTAAEPVIEKVEDKVEVAPKILEKKTRIPDKPAVAPETKIEADDKKFYRINPTKEYPLLCLNLKKRLLSHRDHQG